MAKGDKIKSILGTSLDAIVPGAGTIANTALSVIELLADPSGYSPVKYNEGNYNLGGTIKDKKMSSGDVEIQGNSGKDTNTRQILGNIANLTKGETVSVDKNGNANIFSDAKEMPHPDTGKSFAETVKPVQKAIGRAEKKIGKLGRDKISQNTIAFSKDILEVNKAKQDRERAIVEAKQVQQALRSVDRYLGGQLSAIGNYYLGNNEPLPGRQFFSTYGSGIGEGVYSGPNPINNGMTRAAMGFVPMIGKPTAAAASAVSPTANPADNKFKEQGGDKLNNTFGDYLYSGAKTLETIGRVVNAFDAPEQFATDRYNVDRIKLSAQDQLDANNRNYRAAVGSSQTGNANLDRVTGNALFASKIQADNAARRDVQNRQAAADLDVNKYNAQQKALVDQINSQTQAAKAQAVDSALSSIGSLGQVYMDMFNTSAQNRVTLATLNSLSRYYGIDTENLVQMMKTNPDQFNGMLTRFKEQNEQ